MAEEAENIAIRRDFRPTAATVYQLELQDYVMFTSRDFGRLQVTERNVLSNYALTYALGRARVWEDDSLVFPKSQFRTVPAYTQDFGTLCAYVTPARAVFSWHYKKVYNTIPEIYAERAKPMYAKVVPAYGRYDMLGIGSQFVFVVLWEEEPEILPRYIRLGRFLGTVELTLLAQCRIRERTKAQPFRSLPVHRDDVPVNLSVIVHDLIRLGKRHAVLLDSEFNCPFWEIVDMPADLKRLLGEGLPKGVFYCARTAAQNCLN